MYRLSIQVDDLRIAIRWIGRCKLPVYYCRAWRYSAKTNLCDSKIACPRVAARGDPRGEPDRAWRCRTSKATARTVTYLVLVD
jgi:hypothetical protein